MWNLFLELYQEDLYYLWCNWIPLHKTVNKNKVEKIYLINNEDYNEDYNEEFIELVDNGDRVLSFEDFVCCAYENTQ